VKIKRWRDAPNSSPSESALVVDRDKSVSLSTNCKIAIMNPFLNLIQGRKYLLQSSTYHWIVAKWQKPTRISLHSVTRLSQRIGEADFKRSSLVNYATVQYGKEYGRISDCRQVILKNALSSSAHLPPAINEVNQQGAVFLRKINIKSNRQDLFEMPVEKELSITK
jgi:hypothetical protein